MKYEDAGYELGSAPFTEVRFAFDNTRIEASTTEILAGRTMSHELRTPLNAVIGLADLLLLDGGELSARQREYIDGIAQSGRQLLALIDGVLDLARIEAGALAIELEDVALVHALNEAAAALERVAGERGVAITIELESADDTVCADRFRLRQLLCNLVSNAVKATGRDGTVTLRSRRELGCVAIDVVADGTTGEVGNLELALTKRLVEIHAGTLEVASERGVGTTATLRLPVVA